MNKITIFKFVIVYIHTYRTHSTTVVSYYINNPLIQNKYLTRKQRVALN